MLRAVAGENGTGATLPEVMKTLLLNPPSLEDFDGGASSRWPVTREIESCWYPVWLTDPAGMLPRTRLPDASPQKVTWAGKGPEKKPRVAVPALEAGPDPAADS